MASIKNEIQPGYGNRLNTVVIRAGNRFADILAGVNRDKVLNGGYAPLSSENPAQALLKAANAMKAEAVNPETGEIDYLSLADCQAYSDFRQVAQSLATCNISDIGDRDSQIAFWINLYNAMILDAVIQYQIRSSLSRQIGFFRRAAYRVGGMRFSADDIEHGVLRGNRRHPALPFPQFAPNDPRLLVTIAPLDPRVHFALVCGARSCPPIAFYDGGQLDQQLNLATSAFINGGGSHFDPKSNTLWLSKIFQWYQADFGGRRGALQTVRQYLKDSTTKASIESRSLRIRYLPYDWTLNAIS